MQKLSLHILRIGLGITFLWVGILIFQNPEAWGGYISPWALELLPMPIKEIMLGTAFLDMALGVLLLSNSFVWIASLVASLHLVSVLMASGINEGTVRDIAILAGAISLTIDSLPEGIAEKIRSYKKGK